MEYQHLVEYVTSFPSPQVPSDIGPPWPDSVSRGPWGAVELLAIVAVTSCLPGAVVLVILLVVAGVGSVTPVAATVRVTAVIAEVLVSVVGCAADKMQLALQHSPQAEQTSRFSGCLSTDPTGAAAGQALQAV